MTTVAELLKLKDEQHRVTHTVTPDQKVFEVITLMAERNIGAVPVVENGKVVGIVSERDYVRKMELKGRASVGTAVSDIMTHDVKTVNSQATVDQCMNIMTDRRLRHLPVVDDGQLVGLLSIGDLVKDATTQVSTLVRAEVELARAEITRDVKKGLTGSVFFILALVVLFYSTFFFFFFVAELLDGQPDAHAYFGRMKRENREGPAVMGERAPLTELAAADVVSGLARDTVTFVDTRSNTEVHEGTVTGSLNIPAGKSTASFGAWVVNPETDTNPLVLLAPSQAAAQDMWDHLVRVGIDQVAGYVTSIEGLPSSTPKLIQPEELDGFDSAMILDVRNRTEHAAGHIPGSHQLSGGRVMWNLNQLPAEGTIVSYCQSGVRNSVAASALRRAGYDVVELDGSYAAWAARQHSTALAG